MTDSQLQMAVCLLLSASTLGVFWNVQFHEFILYDDPFYVTLNQNVQSGLTLNGIFWAFTTTDVSNWHPFMWLSLMVDFELFRLNPAGYHWTNLLFHVANVTILFTVFNRMTADIWRSSVVAMLFAIHPLHVESVAWISERKDVLSTFFWLLTIWAYSRYTIKSGTKNYILLIVAFALGLMAKPMLVTLPFVLILLDIWPLKRLRFALRRSGETLSSGENGGRITWGHAVREKWLLFALAAISSFITFYVQLNWKAVGTLEAFSLKLRIENALISYIHYITNMMWPANMAFFYPYAAEHSSWLVAGALLLLSFITVMTIRTIASHPYLAVGWFWYMGTLLPVIGLVQIGSQSMADRYTYVPLIGLFIMIAWGVPELFGKWRFGKTLLAIVSCVVLSVLAVCTWQQVQYWKNSITLFERALSVTSGNYLAHNNLGVALFLEGRKEEAVRHYFAALRIKPDYVDAHNNLGVALVKVRRFDEAVYHYSEALRIKPDHEKARMNLDAVRAIKDRLKNAHDCSDGSAAP